MIYKICPLITQDATQTLVEALVTSKLDYGNALYFDISKSLIDKLQLVKNAAAHLVCGAIKYDHITQVLRALHWLPIEYRIEYKIILLCFKARHGLAPGYISDLLQLHRPARSLRSNSLNLLEVPRTRRKTYGDRAFSAVALRLWNSSELKTLYGCSKKILRHTYSGRLINNDYAKLVFITFLNCEALSMLSAI